MLNKIATLLIFVLCSGCLHAQIQSVRFQQAGRSIELVATIHVGGVIDQKVQPELAKSLSISDVVFFESDAVDVTLVNQLSSLVQDVRRSNESRSVLSKTVLAEIQGVLRVTSVNIPGMSSLARKKWERLAPIEISDRLASVCNLDLGLLSSEGVDRALYTLAGEQGKKIQYLEKGKEALEYYSFLTPAQWDTHLKSQITFVTSGNCAKVTQKMMARLFNAYRRGDFDELYRVLMNFYEADVVQKPFAEKFIDERTQIFLKKILASQSKNTVVCVGAAHLGGEQGLIKSLRRLGFVETKPA